jgi:flagellar biosynthesis/type III secretory pathway protein FliH
MAEPPISRQAKDILLKRVAGVLGDALGRRFGLDLPGIVAHIPSDLPVIEVRAQNPDLLFLLSDGTLLLLELQSRYSPEHLLRFGDYTWSAFRAHGRRVHTVVLYGPDAGAPSSLVDAGSMRLEVTNILLGEHDAEEALEHLTAKVARSEPLTSVDRIDLVLTPLMRQRRPLEEVVRDLLPLVSAVPENEQAETVGTIVGLAYHYLDEGAAAALLEGLKMANKLVEMIADGIEQGIEQGRELGIEQGRELGIELGIEQGRHQGIEQGIEQGRELGIELGRHQGIEQGRHQGIEQGRELGIELGRHQGIALGQREAVRTVVRARFGAIPASLETRITNAGEEDLAELLARAAIALRVDAI